MKIGHVNTHGSNRLVIFENEKIAIDVNALMTLFYKIKGKYNPQIRADHSHPSSLYQLLTTQDLVLERLQQVYDIYKKSKSEGWSVGIHDRSIELNLDTANTLKCPLDKIGTYRDFFIHEKHVVKGFQKRGEKVPEAWYQMPVFYKGSINNFIGHEEEIMWPSYTQTLDYELELGIVIGKDGFNIQENEAMSHIFGLTILNDVSARDIQRKEMSVRLGPSKGKDFCSVIGPWIVTMDEFNWKMPDLCMTAKVNGSEWSRGQSGDGHFSFNDMIGFASSEEWLCAGDLLGSGTVGTGCGLELERYPKNGDVIEMEIEKIGILRNTIGAKRKEQTWITSNLQELSASRPT